MSQPSDTAASGPIVRQLHPALGAEIGGLDLDRPLDPAMVRMVHDAWMAHLVLVFPGQPISDTQQIAFARNFGDLEVHHQAIIRSARAPEIFRVSNVEEDGTLMAPNHPSVAQISLAQRWHTDSSFRPVPAMGSILRGVEVTEAGGETCFTNMYRVYQALPAALKRRVEGRRARHDFAHLATLAPIKPLSEAERAAMPPVWQPMVRRHPVTGRKSLYISPIYNARIEGMADDDAVDLIAELAAFAGRPAFVYRHRWTADEIVMWDNRCTMQRVSAYDLRGDLSGDGIERAERVAQVAEFAPVSRVGLGRCLSLAR